MKYKQLNESLRSGDLERYVSDLISVDQYKSKMGEDSEVLVLGFLVQDKYPAIDLMEFMERGYNFILDSDISAGEEKDGKYQVFVEIERTPNLPQQLNELLRGLTQLCNQKSWSFRYQKNPTIMEFSKENIEKYIPMTKESYAFKILEIKETDLKKFFNQGSVDLTLSEDNIITFRRPFAGDLTAKFVAIGDFNDVSEIVPGALSLDESSQSQIFFLNKFLGNYDINKIGNKFLIRNDNQAIIIEKDRW